MNPYEIIRKIDGEELKLRLVRRLDPNLIIQGYRTGKVRLEGLGMDINLLPIQIYRDNGFVDVIKGQGDRNGRSALCEFNYEEGVLRVDVRVKRSLNDIERAFALGHEEGHACVYFGKLSEAIALIRDRDDFFGEESSHSGLLDSHRAEVHDKELILGHVGTCIGRYISERERMEKSKRFINFLRNESRVNDPDAEKFSNLCGIYAVQSRGYSKEELVGNMSDQKVIDLIN